MRLWRRPRQPCATDSKAAVQMALQTTDVWAVLQLCDARLEVERDQQRQLDCAGWHGRLDRNRDFDLDSARVCGGE